MTSKKNLSNALKSYSKVTIQNDEANSLTGKKCKNTVIFMIIYIFILYHQQNCCQYHEYSTSYSPNAHSCYILTKCPLKDKHPQTAVMSSKKHTVDVCMCVCVFRQAKLLLFSSWLQRPQLSSTHSSICSYNTPHLSFILLFSTKWATEAVCM